MFRKKSAIPERPELPATESIVDDVQNAPTNDVVFTYFKEQEIKLGLSGFSS